MAIMSRANGRRIAVDGRQIVVAPRPQAAARNVLQQSRIDFGEADITAAH
jgi:orotidine-5'-phosphate decarboxylase